MFPISIIAAIDLNLGLGLNGKMPWYLPKDLNFFKQQTLGKTIVMGRNTWLSIGSKPLPERHNVVISRQHKGQNTADVTWLSNTEDVFRLPINNTPLMVIGGASIYQQFIDDADELILTRINHAFKADVFFPELQEERWFLAWQESHPADANNSYSFTFEVHQRRSL